MTDGILRIEDLRVEFHTRTGIVRAVDGVSFEIPKGKTMGLVGESGCGKTVTALSILRLIDPAGSIVGGRIVFDGIDLAHARSEDLRTLRGNRIAMIFQEPMTSLNPVFTVGDQIAEAVRIHKKVNRTEARGRAIEMLRLVGIPSPERRVADYPHHLSGGMRQRAMIAMALSCEPELLIADEPTTALDVTIQAQILDLMRSLQERFKMSILLITHDLGVVAATCDEVTVMYAGEVIERADVRGLFRLPQMPYTEGLLNSIPKLGVTQADRLPVIAGSVPNPRSWPAGCRFAPRCHYRFAKCAQHPPLFQLGNTLSRCWLAEQGQRRTLTAGRGSDERPALTDRDL
jgi:peptide/nickel transport system ATP-binding protein/oligopeptide transport system ATP-binding protein